MTSYEIESQIRRMLDKFQHSDFSKREVRRCISNVIANRLSNLSKESLEIYNPNNRKKYE